MTALILAVIASLAACASAIAAPSGSAAPRPDPILAANAAWHKGLKVESSRADDELTRRGNRLLDRLYPVFQTLPPGPERQQLDHIHDQINRVLGAWQTLHQPPAAYLAILEELEGLTKAGQPPSEQAGQLWASHVDDFLDGAEALAQPGVSAADLPWTSEFSRDGRAPDLHEVWRPICDDALRRLATRDYSGLERLIQAARAGKYDDRRRPAIGSLYEALAGYDGGPDPSCASKSNPAHYRQQRQALEAWRQALPSSTAARIALADLVVSRAWEVRGHSAAALVPDRDFKLFKQMLDEATVILDKVPPDADEYRAVLQIRLELESNAWGRPLRALRKDAAERLKAYPDSDSLRCAVARASQERWIGYPGDLPRYLQELLGSESEVEMDHYAAVAICATESISVDRYLGETGANYPALREAIATRDRRSGLTSREWEGVLKIAMAARDRALALSAIDRIAVWNRKRWGSKEYYAAVVAWARGSYQ